MHPEALGREIIRVLDDTLAGIADIERILPGVLRDAADKLEFMGVPYPDWAKDAAYEAAFTTVTIQLTILRESVNFMRDEVAKWGMPTQLREEATRLENGVRAAFSGLETDADISEMDGLKDAAWDSPIVDRYSEAFYEQRDQVSDLLAPIDALIRVLRDSASSQDSWYSENLLATIGYCVSVAGVAVALGTGVTGVGAVVGLVIGIIGVIVSAIGVLLTAPASQSRADTLTGVLSGAQITEWPNSRFAW